LSSSIAPSHVAPSPSTFASRCPIHHLRRSRRWLVVAFSARPAAYQQNHQVAQWGLENAVFFWQRDSHSAGCTRQTPPNRVSADSPSRILPGDVLVSLRLPPPKKLQRCECCEWPSGKFYFSEVFFGGRSKKKKRGQTTRLHFSTPHIKIPFCHEGYFLVLFGAPA
jgi:hypothetical protein